MEGAIIQLLSLVFGSAAVVLVADLGLDGVDALVMVTVVLVPVVVVVFNVEAAGFTAGSAPGCAAAGSVKPAGSPVPPTGTSFPSVSPAGVVAPSGSINTCAAGRCHKLREHKRSARARDSAIGTDRIKPRDIDGKSAAGRAIAKTCVLQTHTINAHAHSGAGADGCAREVVKLQMVGIGPDPARARHARLVVRRARDDEALRARGIRRPAQQNA